jgi:hypothetical protein
LVVGMMPLPRSAWIIGVRIPGATRRMPAWQPFLR